MVSKLLTQKSITQQACSTLQEVFLSKTQLFGQQISAHRSLSCSWVNPLAVQSYELYHQQGNICAHFVYSASFRALGIIEKLLLKDLVLTTQQLELPKVLGFIVCFFLPFIHTQKDYLRRLVILQEILGLQYIRYVQKILIFMLKYANQRTS